MMTRGILVFNYREQEWIVWIGQQSYWINQGYTFELRIQNRYYLAYLYGFKRYFCYTYLINTH